MKCSNSLLCIMVQLMKIKKNYLLACTVTTGKYIISIESKYGKIYSLNILTDDCVKTGYSLQSMAAN